MPKCSLVHTARGDRADLCIGVLHRFVMMLAGGPPGGGSGEGNVGTTIREVFEAAGLVASGRVQWGARVPADVPGVYLVATTPDPDETSSDVAVCPVDVAAVGRLLAVRSEATVDGVPATVKSLSKRLAALWLPNEPVLYIGLAGTSLQNRVGQYYGTKLGARAPHAGGWPVKTLSNLPDLWVHFAACDDPDTAEKLMVVRFVAGVPGEVVAHLHDPSAPLPFANLMFPGGSRKVHGMRGVKAPRLPGEVDAAERVMVRPATNPAVMPTPTTVVARPKRTITSSTMWTQQVSQADLNSGQIRVPVGAKRAFPAAKGTVDIDLRGERLTCRWDPKSGQGRSGVVRVPKAVLARLVLPSETLTVTSTSTGVLLA